MGMQSCRATPRPRKFDAGPLRSLTAVNVPRPARATAWSIRESEDELFDHSALDQMHFGKGPFDMFLLSHGAAAEEAAVTRS